MGQAKRKRLAGTPEWKLRVEAALPSRFMFQVVRILAEDPEDPVVKDLLATLSKACHEPFEHLRERDRLRQHDTVEETHERAANAVFEKADADKVGMSVYYMVEHLLSTGYFVLEEGSPLANAMHIVLGMLTDSFAKPKLDRSARKAARHLLEHLQGRGFFEEAEPMPTLEDLKEAA